MGSGLADAGLALGQPFVIWGLRMRGWHRASLLWDRGSADAGRGCSGLPGWREGSDSRGLARCPPGAPPAPACRLDGLFLMRPVAMRGGAFVSRPRLWPGPRQVRDGLSLSPTVTVTALAQQLCCNTPRSAWRLGPSWNITVSKRLSDGSYNSRRLIL